MDVSRLSNEAYSILDMFSILFGRDPATLEAFFDYVERYPQTVRHALRRLQSDDGRQEAMTIVSESLVLRAGVPPASA